MNDFNQFLTLLRAEQSEKEKQPAAKENVAEAVKAARPVVPMKGEFAKPIGAEFSQFLEAVEEIQLPQAEETEVEKDLPVEEEAQAVTADDETAPQEEDIRVADFESVVEAIEQVTAAPQAEGSVANDKTRIVTDLSQVPVSTEEQPAPGSVSAAKTVILNDQPTINDRTTAFDFNEAPLLTEDFKPHIRAVPQVTAPEKIVVAAPAPVDERTKHLGKGNLLRAIAKTARASDQAEGQIMMEGFDANDPVQTDEQTMEDELRSVREKRIEEFGLPKTQEAVKLPENDVAPRTKTIPLPAFLAAFAEKYADRETEFVDMKTEEFSIQ